MSWAPRKWRKAKARLRPAQPALTEPIPPDDGSDMQPGVAWYVEAESVSQDLAERWGFAPQDSRHLSIIRSRKLAFRAATELQASGHHGFIKRRRHYGASSIGARKAVLLSMEI